MNRKLLINSLIQELILQPKFLVKPRRDILELIFNKKLTAFNANNFIKRSKKGASALKYSKTDVLQYSMVGKCIKYNLSGTGTTFTIRNVIDLASYEMTLSLWSPLIKYFCIRDYKERRLKYTKSTQYFLRTHSPVRSMVSFHYVMSFHNDFLD